MSKKKPLTYRRKVIFLIVTCILLLFILVVGKLTLFQGQFIGTNTENKTNLLTFKSSRVPLTFNYPVGFPVTVAGAEYEKGYLDKVTLEDLNFSETYMPNASDDSYGYITVKKMEIIDLQKYLQDYYKFQADQTVTFEKAKTADVDGYRVHITPDTSKGGYLGSVADWTYFFYKNGLLYQIALTNPGYKNSNPTEISKIFTDTVLFSMKFE